MAQSNVVRHPLVQAFVAAGVSERWGASAALALRHVLDNINTDCSEQRSRVDMAANLDLFRLLIEQLGKIMTADILVECIDETIRRENAMRTATDDLRKSLADAQQNVGQWLADARVGPGERANATRPISAHGLHGRRSGVYLHDRLKTPPSCPIQTLTAAPQGRCRPLLP